MPIGLLAHTCSNFPVTLPTGAVYAPSDLDDSLVNQQLAVFGSFGVDSLKVTQWVNASELVEFDSCFNLVFLVLWRTPTGKITGGGNAQQKEDIVCFQDLHIFWREVGAVDRLPLHIGVAFSFSRC